ncbi:GAF and ANTAR domain-containing protein [Mycolicibacterium sp. S2-37]|uniref:GAF and ANTAR domain-containing protein n=1 Tax=Mycolicibacterium sp. S2-37 TaxID=2810297 RepID=UPI001A9540ED|nr:GAF and ANTAR domain-containing protein [Mycolicibacterium sp. S2-37]MBO0678697.1 GAF and ANTAR domain-containing protein [Mycolicibacterium sp. S2-37]
MTLARPDEIDRLESAADALESLLSLFASEEPLDAALKRVAASGADAIADADAVSITVLTDPTPRTAAYTDEQVLQLDHVQYSSGRGPCLDAAERRRPVRVGMDTADERWPEFVDAARSCGISATLSVPLLVDRVDDESELVGSLNIYSTTATAFDPFDETLMRLYMLSAGHAITTARRMQRYRETVDQLREALTSRSNIDQAKGALRAIHGCSEDEAFQRLVTESQNNNVKLHSVARAFLESLRRE